MEQSRVRIVDIAQTLGLSPATVSNVLHGKTEKLSGETVKRVQQELERTGYIPNMAGILLARNNSRIIGVVVNLGIDHYGGGCQAGRHFRELGHTKALCIADNAVCMDKEWIDGFRSGGRTKITLVIDCLGTWCVGIPLCLLAAYGLRWGIVGVYALLNAEEALRLVLSLVMFRRRSWMVSLSEKQNVP